MKLPRVSPLLCALSFCAMSLLLVGCGGGTKQGDGKIVLWVQMDPAERTRFEANLAAYRTQHPDAVVEFVPYDTENLRQQFQTAAAAGAGPELIFGPSDQVGPLSLLQLLKPLDEAMPAGFFDRFIPQSLDTLNGHLWAAPDQIGNHLMLLYNKALVPTPPADHAAFMATAKRLTGGGTYGFAMNMAEPYWLAPFLVGYGGWVMDATNSPSLDSQAMRDALAYLASLKAAGIMPKESDYQVAETLFKEGKAGMIVNGPWSWAGYRDAGLDLGVAPLWVLPNGRPAQPMTASKGYSINANVSADELPAVIELVTFLTSPEAELRDAVSLSLLPSHRDAWADASIQADPVLRISQLGIEQGRRMPVVPEMRVLWDTMRPGMQQVMNGSRTPEVAAREMQAAAVQQIAGMKR